MNPNSVMHDAFVEHWDHQTEGKLGYTMLERRAAKDAFEAGANWQAAQRQGGEAVAKEAHTIACMFSSYARDSLKERGCTDEQLDNWFRILDRALKSAPQPAVPESGWTDCSELVGAGEEMKWAIISSPALPPGWKDDRITDAIERWHDAARQHPEPPEDV